MMNTRFAPRGGFTLLEVMVSLMILALSITVLSGINATSFESSNYAKHLTVATLLARSKMIDVEEELRKDGFGDSDREYDGDFSEEGYPGMKWVAVCRKTEIEVGQLIGGFLGGGSEIGTGQLPEQMQQFLGAMRGEGPEDLVSSIGGSDLKNLMGGGAGGGELFEGIFKQVGETLGNSIREVTLEIKWGREGIDEESVRFVQYLTTNGRISVPAGGFNAAAGLNGGLLPGQLPGARPGNTLLPQTLPGGIKNPALPSRPGLRPPGGGSRPRP